MWHNYIENTMTVLSIYNGEAPSLRDVCLEEFLILTGESLRIQIKIDTHELPQKLPEKWEKSGTNTIQFFFEFIDTELQILNIDNMGFRNGFLKISETKDVVFYSKNGSIIFQLKAKWIYITSITGYHLE